jgi:hypothetical protein
MITFCQVTSCGTTTYPGRARVDSWHARQMCGAIATRTLVPVSIRLRPQPAPLRRPFVRHLPDVGVCRISTNPVSYELASTSGFSTFDTSTCWPHNTARTLKAACIPM